MLRYRVKAKSEGELGGESLWSLLAENLTQRKIPMRRQTVAKKIHRAGDRVVGVTTDKYDRRQNIRARKGVVLATGGFEYNEELKREYLAGLSHLLLTATLAILVTVLKWRKSLALTYGICARWRRLWDTNSPNLNRRLA